jgi:sphingomyelin phosphodiesterase
MHQAGKYGSFGDSGCDIPTKTFESMIKFIKNNIKPDFILWTGDLIPHDIWV